MLPYPSSRRRKLNRIRKQNVDVSRNSRPLSHSEETRAKSRVKLISIQTPGRVLSSDGQIVIATDRFGRQQILVNALRYIIISIETVTTHKLDLMLSQ